MLIKDLKNRINQGIRSSSVPHEIIEMFSSKLPGNVGYTVIGPNLLTINKNWQGTFYFSKEKNKTWWDKYGTYVKETTDILDIVNLTQTPIIVDMSKNVLVGDLEIPKHLLHIDITKNDITDKMETYILPQNLYTNEYEISDVNNNLKVKMNFKRQKSDNIELITINNFESEYPLRISIMMCSKFYRGDNKDFFSISIGTNQKKAKTVEELLTAYLLYRSFVLDGILINKSKVTPNQIEDEKKDKILSQLENNIKILLMLVKIEKELSIRFNPTINIEKDDIDIIAYLYSSIIMDKTFQNKEVLNTLTFSNELENDDQIKNAKDNKSAFMISGKITINILDATINMFEIKCYVNTILSSIEKNSNNNYILHFECNDKEYFCGSKLFKTEEKMEETIKLKAFNMNNNDYLDTQLTIDSVKI